VVDRHQRPRGQRVQGRGERRDLRRRADVAAEQDDTADLQPLQCLPRRRVERRARDADEQQRTDARVQREG